MAEAGESFFTRKGGGRSEAKDGGDESARGEAKGGRAALNELEDAGDASSSSPGGGAKGGASPQPPRASVGWGSDAAALEGEPKDGGSGGGGEAKRAGRRRKGSDTGAAGLGGGGKGKNRHFDEDGESTGGGWSEGWRRVVERADGLGSAEIMEIPDLEEEEREPDITTQSAAVWLMELAVGGMRA